jgi:hypothetical protein
MSYHPRTARRFEFARGANGVGLSYCIIAVSGQIVLAVPFAANNRYIAMQAVPDLSQESFQTVFPVAVAAEEHLTLVTPANQMVKRSRIFHFFAPSQNSAPQ